ncbi:MAG: hypothetical protein ISQ86_01730, partial [Alphaproteobacteria bacterium]|nr:hypothetical protein [Alphaproteobacteria bacterium]
SFALFIAGSSAVTAVNPGHQHHVALALAVPEFVAALAFLFRPIERAACAVLLLVFASALVVSIALGDYLAPLRFGYFAMTAVFIVSAGWRERESQERLAGF